MTAAPIFTFCKTLFSDENNPAETPTEARMTTWSNLGSKQKSKSYSQQQQSEQPNCEENQLNNNNNGSQTTTTTTSSAPGTTSKSRSLPDFAGRGARQRDNRNDQDQLIQITPTESKLVSNFMKNRSGDSAESLKHLEFECPGDEVNGAAASVSNVPVFTHSTVEL